MVVAAINDNAFIPVDAVIVQMADSMDPRNRRSTPFAVHKIDGFQNAFTPCILADAKWAGSRGASAKNRSEEHTSELQSPDHLVCRLLLEKKNIRIDTRRQSSLRSLS